MFGMSCTGQSEINQIKGYCGNCRKKKFKDPYNSYTASLKKIKKKVKNYRNISASWKIAAKVMTLRGP